ETSAHKTPFKRTARRTIPQAPSGRSAREKSRAARLEQVRQRISPWSGPPARERLLLPRARVVRHRRGAPVQHGEHADEALPGAGGGLRQRRVGLTLFEREERVVDGLAQLA